MGRTAADAALLLSAMVSDDKHDMLATTIHGRQVRLPRDYATPATFDLSSLKVALTVDFGFAPTEVHIAEVFTEKTNIFLHVFAKAEHTTPDCTGADASFEILRSLGFLRKHHANMQTRPDDYGPNIHANYQEGLAYSAMDVSNALGLQLELYQRWQSFFDHHDIILAPSICISPRPWSELAPTEINGKSTRTYFHWLALSYVSSLIGHPSLSLPVGLDHLGMPFGLQIIGPRGGDTLVLAVAAALEAYLATNPITARPTPNLAKLQTASPINQAPGFLGFG